MSVMKEFNVNGLCIPGKHYMADTSGKVADILTMVEKGNYFTINCPRQYGKTTTLGLLGSALSNDYTTISISFEAADDKMFESSESFCKRFIERCADALGRTPENISVAKERMRTSGVLSFLQKFLGTPFKRTGAREAGKWKCRGINDFDHLHKFITKVCRNKKYVLMIDEVDKSSNNNIFLKFLGMLRDKYLLRNAGKDYTFHSVILVGVHNIKNLKKKMEQAGYRQDNLGEAEENSLWNIAANFRVDMSLSVSEISSMLADYENDHNTGMDIESVAREIRAYTNGYPYLVSRICQAIDTELDKDWTPNGVTQAVTIMLREDDTPLIDDITKNLNNNKDLDALMFNIVARGEKFAYGRGHPAMALAITYGFIIRQGEDAAIGNKFFEMLLYKHYAQILDIDGKIRTSVLPSEVISNGRFNMPLAIEKFAWHYYEMYRKQEADFIEDQCRMLFITFIRAMINGNGHYFVESETRNAKRTDVIVTYADEQYVIELKIWRGEIKHEQALDQIAEYLNSKNKDTGYLLTFDFRKKDNSGEPKTAWVEHNGKKIFDVTVGL